jgi:hypothetical protein
MEKAISNVSPLPNCFEGRTRPRGVAKSLKIGLPVPYLKARGFFFLTPYFRGNCVLFLSREKKAAN